jgi:hypothetical protein
MRTPDCHPTRPLRLGLIALALTAATLTAASARAAPVPELSASAAPGELVYGATLSVSGRIMAAGQGIAGAPLALQGAPYPYHGFAIVARLASAPDGTFAFTGVRPDRNTRLRVVEEGSPATISQVLSVIVDPSAVVKASDLGPGRTHLSLRVSHTPRQRSPSVSAWWFVAARGTRTFRLAAVTPTRELSSGVTYASATIDPPSKRFVYRVCLNPAWEHAMGARATHHRCPERDFTVSHNVP